jgi:thiol-disulfide isomerase/thioredoxin
VDLRFGITLLVLASGVTAEASAIERVTGRVVDTQGKPVPGVRVAEDWSIDQRGPLSPYRPAVTGPDGKFSFDLEFFGRDIVVMAGDAEGKTGGLATISAKTPRKPIEIKLSLLAEVRVRYASEKPDLPLPESFVTVFLPTSMLPVARGRSRGSSFAFKLPPGRYTFQEEGGGDNHEMDSRELTLAPGKSLDLGEIRLRLSTIAKLYGKPAPAWHFADARDVLPNVQPVDFKGKWLVLEFWGYWCGPCTFRGLPAWMDFFDYHAADRDKFVVLAVHERNVTDFASLDAKLKPIIARVWRGRALPFPILLDTTGAMAKDYGVHGYPTAVLIDPEGRVVDLQRFPGQSGSEACEILLASKLTPVPAAERLDHALDRELSLYVDDEPLSDLMDFYGRQAHLSIRLDRAELKAVGIKDNVAVPLKVGGRHTLRSWLDLTLDPLGLTYVADGDGLRIVRRSPGNNGLSRNSARQVNENALIAEALEKKVTLEFHGESLKQVVALLETKTDETFLLDPEARLAGSIKPDTKVNGSVVDEPLSSALDQLLSPLGMTYIIRDESVILTKSR